MELSLNAGGLIAFLLAFARAVAWLMVVPPFSNRRIIPPIVTMCTASGLALLVGPTIPRDTLPTTTPALIGSLVASVVTGLALGFFISLLLSAVMSAGSMLDLAGGLTLPPSIDPLSLEQTPLMGQFYEQVGVLLLFVSGGYLVMVAGFIHSFQVPPFSLETTARLTSVLIIDLEVYFVSAVEIAAPIMVVLFAAQVVLALLAKSAPQVNVWLLGFPLQIFLVLVLVAVGISVLPDYVTRLLTRAVADGLSVL
ncbi:MAG TPA: flagellar biosynthetic protein FliR [Acidimicrobiales bacterium]|nr:flagellar biosynthetic protein FliR [Acidimicrobiales bacterium]